MHLDKRFKIQVRACQCTARTGSLTRCIGLPEGSLSFHLQAIQQLALLCSCSASWPFTMDDNNLCFGWQSLQATYTMLFSMLPAGTMFCCPAERQVFISPPLTLATQVLGWRAMALTQAIYRHVS